MQAAIARASNLAGVAAINGEQTTSLYFVAAAVGWARPTDPKANGVIMEFHDKATREEAERAIVHMLEEAFRARGWTLRDMKVCAVEHRVERTGCALAAVTLLSDDDIV